MPSLTIDTLPDLVLINGDCWLWQLALTSRGYGWASYNGRRVRAHRAVRELLVGPVPEGLVLDHLCRVRHCVNPDHTEPVTQAENIRRSPTTPAARNARMKICKYGHPLRGKNVYLTRAGHRRCRLCNNRRFNDDISYWD